MLRYYANPLRDPDGAFEREVRSVAEQLNLTGSGIMICLGGDGTLLRAAKESAKLAIPVLGINYGDVGFLSAFGRDKLRAGLTAIARGAYETGNCPLLRYETDSGLSGLAFNELVLHRGAAALPLRLSAEIPGRGQLRYLGDGLIIATPIGSTAYSQNSGGPVIDTGVNALLLTPVCCGMPPRVVSDDSRITITVTGDVAALLSADGETLPELLHPGESVRLFKAAEFVQLIRLREQL
ncbi:MAG: NAD(+)/NADH kinase [Oscillospiraceae bacterium]|jgi:NAD+ kinase|nr:NAD(+)/NADH kinase [Oscillospiraceae bacterium]